MNGNAAAFSHGRGPRSSGDCRRSGRARIRARWGKSALAEAAFGIARRRNLLKYHDNITLGWDVGHDYRKHLEAKQQLSTLLDRVEDGEEVVITRHGKPVARLVSVGRIERERVNEAFERLKALRKGTTLGGHAWQALRDEGCA